MRPEREPGRLRAAHQAEDRGPGASTAGRGVPSDHAGTPIRLPGDSEHIALRQKAKTRGTTVLNPCTALSLRQDWHQDTDS
jgi:hypothetical protein